MMNAQKALLDRADDQARVIAATGAVDEFKDVMPGDAETFLYTSYRGLWAHARELGGVV